MTRQAYVDHERKLIVFWSPKCACTALVKWWWAGPLGQAGTDLAEARRALKSGHRIKHPQLHRIDLGLYRKIAVSRHPFERAVSVYVEKFVTRYGGTRLDAFAKLSPYAADFWCLLRGVDKDAAPRCYDGLSFVEFLTGIEAAVAAAAPEPELNHHWNTQVPLVFGAGAAAFYDSIFDVSQLDGVLAGLNRDYGFTMLPGRVNATVYGAFDGSFLGDVGSLELARRKQPLSPENFRSPETKAMVRRAYDIDFRTFGYDAGTASPEQSRPDRRGGVRSPGGAESDSSSPGRRG